MKLASKLLLFPAVISETAAEAYAARVMATSPLRYNKLNETSGTAIVDSSGNAYTGTYSGVTLANTDSPFAPDDAPFWDGVNDYGDLYSVAFASAFNMDEGACFFWVKPANAEFWTDGLFHVFANLYRNGTNRVQLFKNSTNNTLQFRRSGNGTENSITVGGNSFTDWKSLAITWSVANNRLKAYADGVQIGTTQTGLVAATGTGLDATQTRIGATTALYHHGWLSQLVVYNSDVDAIIPSLMTP